MDILANYNFELLKNEAENLVIQELGHQLDAYTAPMCRCNDCILDMAAMALNTVRPLYRVSLLGTMYTSSAMGEKAFASEIRAAVANAINKVVENPGHDIVSPEAAAEEAEPSEV